MHSQTVIRGVNVSSNTVLSFPCTWYTRRSGDMEGTEMGEWAAGPSTLAMVYACVCCVHTVYAFTVLQLCGLEEGLRGSVKANVAGLQDMTWCGRTYRP